MANRRQNGLEAHIARITGSSAHWDVHQNTGYKMYGIYIFHRYSYIKSRKYIRHLVLKQPCIGDI